MIRRTAPMLVALLLGWSTPASAQIPEWVSQLLIAAELPLTTLEARNEGVTSAEIRAVLDAMRAANVRAHEARELIDEERMARRDHGPMDNFGAFVQTKLQAGLRGRDLAAAIRAEHAARGTGHAGDPGRSKAQSKGQSGRDTKSRGDVPDSARATRARGAGAKRPNR